MPSSRQPVFVAVLIAITAIGPFSMQMFLPAIPVIQTEFGVESGTAQLALSLSMVAIAVTSLIFGPLSDRYGRKPVLLVGMGLLITGSGLCALAADIGDLIVGRILQAAGGASGMVLARAIVRDVYGVERAAGMIAYLMMAMVVAPMVAPISGGLLIDFVSWNAVFVAVALAGVVVLFAVQIRLTESRPHALTPQSFMSMLLGFRRLLSSRLFCAYALAGAFSTCFFFSFISYAPYVMVQVLEQPATAYGLYFMMLALGYMSGNLAAARISARVGVNRMILLGTALSLSAAAVMAVLATSLEWTPLALFAPTMVGVFGNGLALPNAHAGALGIDPAAAGTASGLTGFLQMGLAAVVAQAVGTMQDGTPYPMIAFMVLSAGSAFAMIVLVLRTVRRQPE